MAANQNTSGTSATSPATPGWYVIKTTSGYIGLVLHHQAGAFHLGSPSYGTVTKAILVNDATTVDMPTLLSDDSTAVQKALTSLGATAKQAVSFATQADTAAGKEQGTSQGGVLGFVEGLVGARGFTAGKQTTQLLIAHDGSPTASSGKTPVSTTPSGDVTDAGSSASGLDGILAAIDGILSAITNPSNWLRALELIGGAVAVFMALKSLTGVSAPTVRVGLPG